MQKLRAQGRVLSTQMTVSASVETNSRAMEAATSARHGGYKPAHRSYEPLRLRASAQRINPTFIFGSFPRAYAYGGVLSARPRLERFKAL